ncbi:MAG: DUF4390 domain-containing protein [Sulfuricaulis sp.]|nr:DUF4390 domain-containing protein [Sulfuricaulis sp.]
MRASVKTDWRRFAFAALALALFGDTAADFKVTEVQPKLVGQSLVLAGNLDLGLSPKVEEAIAKGIPLEIVIDIRLYHQRRYLWDSKIATWTLNRRIQYHALSGQYLVSAGNADSETRESLLTQQEALKQLGSLNDLNLALAETPAGDGYSVDLRVSLDIEALPAPLRPVAYTSFAWHLNSGWTSWKVAR